MEIPYIALPVASDLGDLVDHEVTRRLFRFIGSSGDVPQDLAHVVLLGIKALVSWHQDEAGMDIVPAVHRSEVRCVVRDEHVALLLDDAAKLGVLAGEHGAVTVAGGLQAQFIGDLHQRWREILVEPEPHVAGGRRGRPRRGFALAYITATSRASAGMCG